MALVQPRLCDTTGRASQTPTHPLRMGEIPLYHRRGDKPLDPTTLFLTDPLKKHPGQRLICCAVRFFDPRKVQLVGKMEAITNSVAQRTQK